MSIIDFHTHVYPLPELPPAAETARQLARGWLAPVAKLRHEIQTRARELPPTVRGLVDEVGSVAVLPNLLLESSPADLKSSMGRNGVDRAVIVAFPPLISSEFILKTAAEDSRLIPAVSVSTRARDAGAKVDEYAEKGARILKIHPLADGLDAHADSYLAQLRAAEKHRMIVIVHSGIIQSRFFRRTEMGSISRFRQWFADHPSLIFLLAHMGYQETGEALELAREFPNVSLSSSWQPADEIVRAVRDVGAKKVLFSSDWRLAGENMGVTLERIRKAENSGALSAEETALILGGNAERILASHGL